MNVQDSIIGALAGVSRIAGCLMFALAPTRQWFYSAPLFNIFSFTGLTAIRSIATKSVPTEEVGEFSYSSMKKILVSINKIFDALLFNYLLFSQAECTYRRHGIVGSINIHAGF